MKTKIVEVWLVQGFEETLYNTPTCPFFTYAFTNKDEAKKVRGAGLATKVPYLMWTIKRVVLDSSEDAMRFIEEMVAVDKEIL